MFQPAAFCIVSSMFQPPVKKITHFDASSSESFETQPTDPQHEHPAQILNVYLHHQLISTINMYDICRLYADMSDMLWMIVTNVDSKDLGMPVGTRSNHPSICLWSSCLSPQSLSPRHPSPLWTPRNASWPPLYSVSLSDRSRLSLHFSFGSKWKNHTKTK